MKKTHPYIKFPTRLAEGGAHAAASKLVTFAMYMVVADEGARQELRRRHKKERATHVRIRLEHQLRALEEEIADLEMVVAAVVTGRQHKADARDERAQLRPEEGQTGVISPTADTKDGA